MSVNASQKYLGTFAALLLAFGSGTSAAAIIGGTDFETGQSVQDNPNIYKSGNSADIVQAESGVTPRRGQWMHRAYLNRNVSPTSYRTESVLKMGNKVHLDKGKEYWLGISVFIPADWNMDYVNGYSEGLVWQFHDVGYLDPTWRKTLPLVLKHSQAGWVITNTATLNGQDRGNHTSFRKVVPYKLGQWNDFVVNAKFSGATSPDDEDGFLKVWVNGEQVLDRVGQNYFGEQTEGPYFKFGMYNWGWRKEYVDQWVGANERVIWHDELRLGDAQSSYAEVFPGGAEIRPKAPGSLVAN